MAQLVRDALDSGVPPALARLPMTPEEVVMGAYGTTEAYRAALRSDPGADAGIE